MKTKPLLILPLFLVLFFSEKHISDTSLSSQKKAKGWQELITNLISESEYYMHDDGSDFTAVNRHTNLRFFIGPQGFTAENRVNKSWNAALHVTHIHVGNNDLTNSPLLAQHADENFLSYEYEGYSIDYMNSQSGMRQNFIINERPASGNEVRIELSVSATDKATIINAGSLEIRKNQNTLYAYSDLKVFDKKGKKLPAHMELENNILALVSDASDAEYPLTIDPVSTTPQLILEGNQAVAHLGFAVSTAGDVNNDGYDDIVVGALAYDNGNVDEGRSYLYLGGPSGVSSTPAWQDESDQDNALYGKSVAAAGDVNGDGYDDVLIGASDYTVTVSDEGAAFLYYGTASGLTPDPVWTYGSGQTAAALGYNIEGLGDVNNDGYADVIIGASGYDNGQPEEGRAYAFYGSATGLSSTPNWTVESNNANAWMGHAVASAGDVNNDGYDDAIVAAWNYSGAVTMGGKAWVYLGGASGLSTSAVWSVEGDQVNDLFGLFAHGVGDVNQDGYDDVMVGAKRYDDGLADEGKVFLYYGGPSGPATTASWTEEGDNDEAEFGDQFGPAGDVNGDGYADIIIGSHFYSNTFTKEGAAFIYYGSSTGPGSAPDWATYGGVAQANYGWSVDGAGDVNNDGFDDVIVGIFKYANGQSDEGGAMIYLGSTDCTVPTGLSISSVTSTSAVANWTTVPSASVYKITAKASGENHNYNAVAPPFTMTGLTPNVKYKVQIQSKCGSVYSAKSPKVSFKTLHARVGSMDDDIVVYPNPASGIIYFRNIGDEGIIRIYSITGQLMKTIRTDENKTSIGIDVSNFSPGIYTWEITSGEDRLTGSFVKK